MLVNHHIAAALASERERDLLAAARRWRTADPVAEVEPARATPLASPTESREPCPDLGREGRISVRISRSRSSEAVRSANARAQARVEVR